jgi:hypothetical protein
MIGNTNHSAPIDGRLFDLLADGELDSMRRHDLLSRLDASPDGWRRCALAFLEAQAWRSDVRVEFNARVAGKSYSHCRISDRNSPRAGARRWSMLALALCVTFGAGWLMHAASNFRPDADGVSQPALVAGRESTPETGNGTTPLEPDEAASPRQTSMRMAGILTLQVDDRGQAREVRVPVLDASGIDVQRLLEQAPAARSPAVQALERRGHKVKMHRQLLTLDLKDGRKLFLPVDQMDVRFANRVYQ